MLEYEGVGDLVPQFMCLSECDGCGIRYPACTCILLSFNPEVIARV